MSEAEKDTRVAVKRLTLFLGRVHRQLDPKLAPLLPEHARPEIGLRLDKLLTRLRAFKAAMRP